MIIYAEILSSGSARYWEHGLFSLKEVDNEYYWVPFIKLGKENPEYHDINIYYILRKTHDEIIEIKIGHFQSYGYRFHPEDLALSEV